MRTISIDQARRIAIRAQLLDKPRPARTRRDIGRLVEGMGVLQIDTVNVLARAHYLPLYSRLGPYDTTLLEDAFNKQPRLILEQWGHEACYVPPATHRLLAGFSRRWNSGHALDEHPASATLKRRIFHRISQSPATSQQVMEWLADEELTDEEQALLTTTSDHAWSRNSVKVILESLFDEDRVAAAGRTHHFHRIYGLTEQTLPPSVANIPPADRDTAIRELTKISLDKVGIGTPATIADFFRLNQRDVKPALDDLVADGTAQWVQVPDRPDHLLPTSTIIPRSVTGTTFLSPFDPLIFERNRAHGLFGLHYRIGIYTPEAQRTRGYYSLPLLHNGTIPARTDLALDRKSQTLLVKGAWYEPGYERPDTDRALAGELKRLGGWLGATSITLTDGAPGEAMEALHRIL
ncbi:winged helix-turn-helix domain-containing protein [Flaviflexus massiliensis]|uniref:winged helix-turn-helix domain-containing protein n=1 Tax=Flaviflexus massiliensis TaxID=1522309 RepID=UPI0006D54AC6|nr:crosslink repair DNA glycosylase YcaQ family protein [Flaviflexus massiliensis]